LRSVAERVSLGLPMHEASIVEAVLERAAQETRKAGATRIERIRLRVGILSGVVPDALRFAFDALRQGTPAADATLEIETVSACFRCLDCGTVSTRDTFEFTCDACGGTLVLDGGGCELELAQLEVS
jgi:hydrogenase nickel incorporation protein HypA/HybF